MRVAILGTGDVGRTLATGLAGAGHAVRLGSRSADHAAGSAWVAATDGDVGLSTFEDAAAWSELAILAVSGTVALSVMARAGSGLKGKTLIDLSNPLDFSAGFPPTLAICNDDSLGEQIQRGHPEVRVVKALNTLGNGLMLSPDRLDGPHDLLICGDDGAAKEEVSALLQTFGWGPPLDLGGIDNARGTEMWLALWTRIYRALGTADFNLHINRTVRS